MAPPPRVLIVEDHPDAAEMLAACFNVHGFEAVSVLRRDDALAPLVSGFKPQFAIIDLVMPGMDLDPFIAELRSLNPAIKIVVVSGFAERDFPTPAGTFRRFLKPVPFETLQSLLMEDGASLDSVVEQRPPD